MEFDDPDFCFCRWCEQRWVMTEDSGWRAVPDHWRDGMETQPVERRRDPYKEFQRRGVKRDSGAKLIPVKRNMRKAR